MDSYGLWQPFTRAQWNSLIDDVNDQIGICEPETAPLSQVGPNHIWSISEIVAMRNKITALCLESPSFYAPLTKWNKEAVDELNEAINYYCSCHCGDWLLDSYRGIDGQESAFGNYNHFGDVNLDGYWTGETYEDLHWHGSFSQSYDFTSIIGQFVMNEMVSGASVGCTLRFYYSGWQSTGYYDPDPQWVFVEQDVPVGAITIGCGGHAESAPSGTYFMSFPQDLFVSEGGAGLSIKECLWDTAGISCCSE